MAIPSCFEPRLCRIIVLGIAFMLLFSAFQTGSMVEKTVLDGAKRDSNGTFKGDGYTSLATVYTVFAVSNWGAPSVVAVCGPILSMIIGAICYFLFVLSFLKPMTATLYIASVLVGMGAAVIWTAQGNYLSINSEQDTIARNSGIFWALLQMSLFLGNLYVFFVFGSLTTITAEARIELFIGLSSVAVAGIVFFMLLPCIKIGENDFITLSDTTSTTDSTSQLILTDDETPTQSAAPEPEEGALIAFKRSIKLMITPNMLLLTVAFAYTGFELTFFSGVYGTMVGNTQSFGPDAKSFIGITGILIGVGEVLGGATFGLFGKKTIKYGRDPIVILGFIVHMICFFLAFMFYPEDSPIRETTASTYFTPNEYVAFVIAFLLGLGDSSYNTQIFSILGDVFKNESSSAFALFKFIQSLAAAAGFFYSTYLLLQWQLLILVIGNFLAVITFLRVERRTSARSREYNSL